jgi:hypothetical protein
VYARTTVNKRWIFLGDQIDSHGVMLIAL